MLAVERGSALSHTVYETFGKLFNLLASTCVACSEDDNVPASWSRGEDSVRRSLPDAVPCHGSYHGDCFQWANLEREVGNKIWNYEILYVVLFFTVTQ